ncbi:MAG: flagellar biosynthesis regulatory protein FlaF [Hyphococcus sp.]|nr:MAG: flagellar biosynthesis regulatory protein FlaF [Marinicaulis sp.]
MIEASFAKTGYENSIQSTGSDRGIEYQIFAQITRLLSNMNTDAPDYFAKLSDALHKNLRLWTVLAVDVANDNNPLPADLRSSLFYLAEFTRKHTAKVYAGEADPKILVDINMSVMKGLRAQTPNEDTQS